MWVVWGMRCEGQREASWSLLEVRFPALEQFQAMYLFVYSSIELRWGRHTARGGIIGSENMLECWNGVALRTMFGILRLARVSTSNAMVDAKL